MKVPEGIYFHGCAWGIAFYVGVYKSLTETYGVGFGKNIKCYGNSIGCIAALTIALGFTWQEVEELYLTMSSSMREHSFFKLRSSDVHNEVIDYVFKKAEEMYNIDRDTIIKTHLIGRYFVGVTKYYATHAWYSYHDYNSLKEALHGSFHIPIYCRKIITYENMPILDGSYSFNPYTDLPNHGKNILKISVGENTSWCDINPFTPLTIADCIVPGNLNKYLSIRIQGIEAADNWKSITWIKEKNKEDYLKYSNKPCDSGSLLFFWPIRLLENYLPVYKYSNLRVA